MRVKYNSEVLSVMDDEGRIIMKNDVEGMTRYNEQ